MEEANGTNSANTITFNIAGAGVHVSPATVLPDHQTVTINGATRRATPRRSSSWTREPTFDGDLSGAASSSSTIRPPSMTRARPALPSASRACRQAASSSAHGRALAARWPGQQCA
jgi:hypothetical protein